MFLSYSILVFASIIHSIGEFLYKKGTENIFTEELVGTDFWTKFTRILTGFLSTIIVVSFLFSLVAKILFGYTLSSIPLSVASPLYLSLVVMFSSIFGISLLNEDINRYKLLGILFICLGIFLVTI